MTEVLGLPVGNFPQWGAFLSLMGLLVGAVTVYIKGIPERTRARNEGAGQESNAETAIRKEYVDQIREFRKEVHGYRNDLQIIAIRLNTSESISRQRGDRIRNMLFIIRLLISELKRIDPTSIVVSQAEAMIEQMVRDNVDSIEPLPPESGALHAAKDAVADAKDTLASTEKTVARVLKNEGDGK